MQTKESDSQTTPLPYYSQNGEDFLVEKLLGIDRKGSYLEVGCLDGMHFSNTFHFYQKGWRGVCVEAHADFYPLLTQNRPDDALYHLAAGPEDLDRQAFYANALGSLSTLDRSQETRFASRFGEYFSGFTEQTIEVRRLDTVLDNHIDLSLDFASIDVEGYEVEVLRGLDLSRHHPRIFIIESHDTPHETSLNKILLTHGYSRLCRIGPNLVYALDSAPWERMFGSVYEVSLLATGNPKGPRKNVAARAILDTTKDNILVERTALDPQSP